MQTTRMTKLDLEVPDDWFIRADDLVEYVTNHTDAGASYAPCGATVMRLALLRGLRQLEAEQAALTETVTLTEVGAAAAQGVSR